MTDHDSTEHYRQVLNAIGDERLRQLTQECWTTEHDDEHTDGALAVVAAQLAVDGTDETVSTVTHTEDRFELVRKHRSDRRRQLIIAASLLVAEIERLDRKELRERILTKDEAACAVADIQHWKKTGDWPRGRIPAWACKVVAVLQGYTKQNTIHHTAPEVFEVALLAHVHYLEAELSPRWKRVPVRGRPSRRPSNVIG